MLYVFPFLYNELDIKLLFKSDNKLFILQYNLKHITI